MQEKDQQWLGILTPFSGLRVLARSGQGLIGESEQLDQLLAKVFKEEMMEGRMARIQDDIVIGGVDQEQAFETYKQIIYKCDKANLKVEPARTHMFPDSADIAGWIWKKGGFLQVLPHRKTH